MTPNHLAPPSLSFLLPFGSSESEIEIVHNEHGTTIILSTPFWEFQYRWDIIAEKIVKVIYFLLPFGSSRLHLIGPHQLLLQEELSTPFWEFQRERSLMLIL